jgi:hypothetical protein
MGRWSGHTKITAYQPCKRNVNNKTTSSSTCRQQTVMLMEEGFNDPNPRQIFIQDIITSIRTINKNPENYIIIMRDANENLNDSEGGLSKLLHETKLIDIFPLSEETNAIYPHTYVAQKKLITFFHQAI